jgi:hypothetical protein
LTGQICIRTGRSGDFTMIRTVSLAQQFYWRLKRANLLIVRGTIVSHFFHVNEFTQPTYLH